MKAIQLFLGSWLVICSVAAWAEEPHSCKSHPQINGACSEVHGRLSFYNGTPSARIWVVGTNRMLGISERKYAVDGIENVPSDLLAQLDIDSEMYADFVVCPFTTQQQGVMQLICVESANHVVVKSRK